MVFARMGAKEHINVIKAITVMKITSAPLGAYLMQAVQLATYAQIIFVKQL